MKIISTADISRFRTVKLRTAQKEMQKIKDYFEKEKHQLICSHEVAEYYGVPESFVLEKIEVTV